MTPINNYFSEERMNRVHQKNAEAIGRINENNRLRMLDAIAAYERTAARKKPRKAERVSITDSETIMAILSFYIGGYSVTAISKMMGLNETAVFRSLQGPLIKHMAGSKDQYLFTSGTTTRIYPNTEAILAELDELDMDTDRFKREIQARTGVSDCYLKRIVGETEGFIYLPVAVEVCHYFGMNADQLFSAKPEKEKTAE